MLLKKLTLTNFRPFKGEHQIDFSIDEDKNVTLVMAENGAGKTTLAQSFQWVLYSKTEGFKNKSVLNSVVEKEMMNNTEEKVVVKLELQHNDTDYSIVRTQKYYKDINGVVKPENPELEIYIKSKDGQTEIVNPLKNRMIVSNILPESLSKYFFFDGERIDKMAGEVSSGKSEEFEIAVQNILGLTALNKAIEHLNPNSKYSVIGKYNAQIDAAGDQQTRELRDIIYKANEKIEENSKKIDKAENEDIIYYEKEIEKAKSEILGFADVEELQQKLNSLNNNLNNEINNKNNQITALMKNFSNQTYNYFSRKLIQEAFAELKNTNNIDKGIPSVRDDTIKFLLKRKKCICGTDLSDPTSEAVINLTELLKYIPPQSLGTAISNFNNQSNSILKSADTYFSTISTELSSIRGCSNRIEEIENNIGEIDKSILRSANCKVTDLKNRQIIMEKDLKDLREQISQLKSENFYYKEKKSNAEAEISRMQMKIEKNKFLEEQLLYAKEAYEQFYQTYEFEESKTREKLEDKINELFREIYAGGMTINIDEKYRITSYVNKLAESSSNLDNNTAKSYSIIFAFIVGVISLAKEKVKEKAKADAMITDEYPLVMDAPLSSFDQKRIKNICNVIPKIARQIIIFIKDSDGNIAKREMNDKIGIEYNVSLRDKEIPVDSKITKVGEM